MAFFIKFVFVRTNTMLAKEKREDCWRSKFIFCKHGKRIPFYNFFL